jgi:hypothetical protein
MAYDNSKHLLLNALLKGLARAIRHDDLSASQRYRERLHMTAEPMAADAPVKEELVRLLSISILWGKATDVERGETRNQLLELIDHVIALFAT